MQRRTLLLAGSAGIAAPALLFAQTLEKPKVTIAVGGKNLLYYLPLTIAESLGYFKAEGLDVTIADFAGGSRALQAMVGGSADVVSGVGARVRVRVRGICADCTEAMALRPSGLPRGAAGLHGATMGA